MMHPVKTTPPGYSRFSSIPLILYRALLPISAPLILEWRKKKGKESVSRIHERRGLSSHPRPHGFLIWIHATSVGEVRSVFPLIEHYTQKGHKVLLTSTTQTSAQLAQKLLPSGALHQFIPLDTPTYVRRFLEHWKPNVALLAESEIWPTLLLEAHQYGIPLAIINGRLSEHSFHRWKFLPKTANCLLSRVHICLMQTASDAQRWIDLGGKTPQVVGNLKYDVPPPHANFERLSSLQKILSGRPLWVAASTHKGEEDGLLSVHIKLRERFPSLLTCIIPRHPERTAILEQKASAMGISMLKFSQGQAPSETTSLYIGDTIGDLGLFYRLGTLVFMGGSLTPHGGQNPLEPIQLGNYVFHGPHISNFHAIYKALDDCLGTLHVDSFDALSLALSEHLQVPEKKTTFIAAGQQHIHKHKGALERTLKILEHWLPECSSIPQGQA
jgi:3-deoxy-D-manno-octulosonic-acid transferase